MILDRLENASRYFEAVPRFDKVMAWLQKTDVRAIPAGTVVLEENNLLIKVLDVHGKLIEDCLFETHNDFIDIQIPITGAESMGWKSKATCQHVDKPYDKSIDMALYREQATTMANVQPGEFVVFFPEDAHQPGIADPKSDYRKLIVKTRVVC